MLILTPSLLIGRGKRRECYHHPDDDKLCVKIVVSGDNKETIREQAYYRFLEKRNVSWEMITRFHGNVETNMGTGAVFQLISDYDGKVSKSLKDYLSSFEEKAIKHEGLSKAICDLKTFLLQGRIITMSLADHNMVFRRINATEGVLVLVDNIGNSDFISVANYINYFAQKKMLYEWKRFESRLLNDYPDNKMLRQIFTDSHVS